MFERWLLKRAARKYATRLPHQLLADYGHKEHYTYRQLEHSIKAARLNQRYTLLACARYLTRDEFNQLRRAYDLPLAYNDAYNLFVTYEPVRVFSASDSPPRGMTGLRRYQ